MNCLILGENTRKTFPIKEINTNNTVGELRDEIRLKNPQRFTSIDAKDLILWRVDIPDEENEKTQLLNTKPSKINIKKDLEGAEMISTTKNLDYYFPEIPKNGHIHIIVQPPAITG